MKRIAIACSIKKPTPEAVSDVKKQIGPLNASMVIYFASMAHEPAAISRAMNEAFPEALVFGCSTSGEITSGKMLKGSVVAMAFSSEAVADVALGVVPKVSQAGSVKGIADVFNAFEKHYGVKSHDMDFSEYVGLVLVDGMSAAEERVMDKIGDLTNVLFVGGSAGDDLQFARTFVYANGEAHTDAAVLALLKPAKGFEIVKTQSFKTTGRRLVATEVNEATREVISFDNRPAPMAYAEAVGTTVEDAPNQFMSHPLGLLADEEIFVRSPQQIRDGKMVFYCNVLKDMEMAVLASTDIVADTRAAIEAKNDRGNPVAGIVNFNCILRTLELEKDNLTEAYGKVFSEIPTVGFSTYGEEYLGHINQTATMLLLK
jgi:hypothetical protein